MKTVHNSFIVKKVNKKDRKKTLKILSAGFLAILIVGFCLNLVFEKEAYGSGDEIVVVVQPGDTLWSIAREYYQDKDIQQAVYHIKKSNGLKSSKLEIGTQLRLPLM